MIIGLFVWSVYSGIVSDPEWWNPLHPQSTGTYLFQIALLLIVVLLFNRRMAKSIKHNYIETAEVYPEVPPEYED